MTAIAAATGTAKTPQAAECGASQSGQRKAMASPGILPLTRELGSYFEHSKPMDEPKHIAGPNRPTRGRWSPEAWAEMEAIWNAPDPCADPLHKAAPIAREMNEDARYDDA